MNAQLGDDIRPSPIAGTWYPGNPAQLTQTIDQMLASAPLAQIEGRIRGLVVPHAGYRYSVPTAACAFKLVQKMTFDRVVVLSPMHHYTEAAVLTSSHTAYQTPLGMIPVDRELILALTKCLPLTAVSCDPEHSLEIELPFLQRVLDGPFVLVPLMLRDQRFEIARRLGEALAEALANQGSTLLVASSDLSHFYTEHQAHQLDQVMLAQMAAFDPQAVMRVEDEGRGFACGRAAIAAALIAARALGANHVEVVGYATSADATGDTQRVVGYGAAAITEIMSHE